MVDLSKLISAFFLSLVVMQFSLLMFASASDASTESESEPLLITMTLKYIETSKDSNWHQIAVDMNDERIILTKEYGGFQPLDPESVEKMLDDEKRSAIRAYIEKNGLGQTVNENKPMDGLGIAAILQMDIKGKSPSNISISGRVNSWENRSDASEKDDSDSNGDGSNIDNMEYLLKAKMFFQFLWDL